MYFLTTMCCLCLQSKSGVNVINTEMLTKLLYCLEKTKDFIPSISVQTKVCNDCLNKLNAAFQFKKMCLNNIEQFKDYIVQLEQICGNFNPNKVMAIELTDVNKLKDVLEINKHAALSHEQYSRLAGFIEDKTICLGEELKLLPQIEEIEEVFIDESADLQFDEEVGKILVKNETEVYLPSFEDSEFQKEPSKEELGLLLHKEEILDDGYDEELPKDISEPKNIVSKEDNTSKLQFICEICENHFNSKKKLMQHMRNHSNINSNKCQNRSYTKSQVALYINERPYSCSICLKSYLHKGTLNQHMLSHYEEKRYSCSICLKSYLRKGTLNQHMLSHSEKKRYSCSICKKGFVVMSKLKYHMLVHSNERLYSCTICTKSFYQKGILTKHLIVHNQKRPFSCSFCTKSFRQKWVLNRHMLIHSSERPFSCAICKKSFNNKSTLKIHMTTVHANERPYSCPICEKNFTCKRYLNQHVVIHSEKRQPKNITLKKFLPNA